MASSQQHTTNTAKIRYEVVDLQEKLENKLLEDVNYQKELIIAYTNSRNAALARAEEFDARIDRTNYHIKRVNEQLAIMRDMNFITNEVRDIDNGINSDRASSRSSSSVTWPKNDSDSESEPDRGNARSRSVASQMSLDDLEEGNQVRDREDGSNEGVREARRPWISTPGYENPNTPSSDSPDNSGERDMSPEPLTINSPRMTY